MLVKYKYKYKSFLRGIVISVGDGKGKTLAWSRGLGMEVSPIKTHSACKKLGLAYATSEQFWVSTHYLGVLRGMKALTRAQS
jgi:hypothetical protein